MTHHRSPAATAPATDGTPEDRGPAILLLSPDLFTSSRLAGLAQGIKGTLTTLRAADQATTDGPWQIVLVDLGALGGDPATILAAVHAGAVHSETVRTADGQRPLIVAFGPHVAKDRLDAARAAGADAAVSRGELLGDFAGVISRVRAATRSA